MSIVCPQCSYANQDAARFCGRCGTRLGQAVLCSSCGAAIRRGAKYCGRCGAPRPGLTGLLRQQFLVSNRYRILYMLAQGGMGAVYLAQDTRLGGKRCAVKEMTDLNVTDPAERQQAIANFQREAQLLAKLDHSNIPKVHDYFTEGGRHYLVMDYVEGSTLQALLDSRGNRPFAEFEVRSWLEQLCDVLHYLHTQRPPVIFRDLKPSNIMVDQRGAVKLIDFGIARFFLVSKAQDTQALGTVGYAAPEAFARRQTDVRSDVYSLGRLCTNW